MKSIHLARIVFLGALCILASSARSAFETFFRIMAWNNAPGDVAVFKKMHDCGIPVAGFVAPKDLDAIASAGLKAIVMDPRTYKYDWQHVDAAEARKKVQSLIAEVGNHP